MRPLGVVMASELPKDSFKVTSTEDQQVVEALSACRPYPPGSAKAFAFGARIGVLIIFTPSVRKTSSNGPENFESRSRIRNRTPYTRSPARFRACCVTQAEWGFAVTPRRCTRRDPSSRANNTYIV